MGNYVSLAERTIALGNGDGTFTSVIPNILPAGDFGLVATGDFNGDGIPDYASQITSITTRARQFFSVKGTARFTQVETSLFQDYFANLRRSRRFQWRWNS